MIALMLLAQPAMFPGAVWLNVVGAVLAVAAIAREIYRGRAQGKLSSGPPAGQPVL